MLLGNIVFRLGIGIAAIHAILLAVTLAAGRMLPSGGEVAFVSDRSGNRDIYVLDVARNLVRNLTNSRAVEFSPAWSPDGSQIAFAAAPAWGYDADLYVMDANGRHVRPLTDLPGNEVVPDWSPDGTQIAFTWNGEGGIPLLYVIDANGENLRGIAQGDGRKEILSLSWSPDGRTLAYSSLYDGWSTHLVTVDGAYIRRLPIDSWLTQYDVDWSPDGRRFIFSSDFGGDYAGYTADIYMFDLETGTYHKLTDGTAYNNYSMWTPDGNSIVFTSWRNGNSEIYVMDTDGSHVRRLTNDPGADVTPSWRP